METHNSRGFVCRTTIITNELSGGVYSGDDICEIEKAIKKGEAVAFDKVSIPNVVCIFKPVIH